MKWEKVNLGDISLNIQTGPFGSQLHQSDYTDLGIPVIMPKDIQGGVILEDSIARVDELKAKDLDRHKTNFDDIIYPRRGDIAKCAIIKDGQVGWLCGTGCLKVTIDLEKANSTFVFYQLNTYEKTSWLEKHAVGATMLNLNAGILGSVPIELPPLPTQQCIASILSRYDDLIENYQQQIKLLEEAAQRLYKEWFVDLHFPGYEDTKIVDGVPEGWKKGILDDIALEDGKRISKGCDLSEYKYYLPIECLPKKSFTYINGFDKDLAKSSLIGFEKYNIIFGAMRPYFHKVCIAKEKGMTRTTCFVIKPIKPKLLFFLYLLLFRDESVNFATSISVGTTMPYTRWNDFRKMSIVVPKDSLVSKFNELIKNHIEIILNLSSQINLLTEARDRLLPKLMSGEIEV